MNLTGLMCCAFMFCSEYDLQFKLKKNAERIVSKLKAFLRYQLVARDIYNLYLGIVFVCYQIS